MRIKRKNWHQIEFVAKKKTEKYKLLTMIQYIEIDITRTSASFKQTEMNNNKGIN